MKAFLIHIASKKKLRVKREFVVGRMDGTKTYPDDGRMSRTHCILRFQDDILTIEDLGSKNGTQIAGMDIEARKPVELVNGDLLTIGDQKFEVMFKGKPKEVPVAKNKEPDLSETLPRGPGESADRPPVSVTAPTQLEGTGVNASEFSRTELVEPMPEKTVADGYTNAGLRVRATSNPGLREVEEVSERSEVDMVSQSGLSDPRDEFVNHPSLPKPDEERFNSDQLISTKGKDAGGAKKKKGILNESSLDPLHFKQQVEELKAQSKEHIVARDFDAESGVSHDLNSLKDEEVKKGLSSLLRSLKKGVNKEKKRDKATAETSRINIPTPSRQSPKSEEVVFARVERPSIVKSLFLLGLLLVAGPVVVLDDPLKVHLLKNLNSTLERLMWIGAFVVPVFLVGIPIQFVRMRSGWTAGMRSIYLTLTALGAVIVLQLAAVRQIERQTGFDKVYFTARVQKVCIEAYKPDSCAELVFQCPQCLKDLSYRDRREFLESIYPTVEVLTKNGDLAASPREPASKAAPDKTAAALAPKAKSKTTSPKNIGKGDASPRTGVAPKESAPAAPGEYPEPEILPDK